MWTELKTFSPGEIVPMVGWTKNALIGIFEEGRKSEIKYLRSRYEAMVQAIAMYKNSAFASISRIPENIRKKPYSECIEMFSKDKKVELLHDLVSKVKEQSRMQWEDAVRTRTGKRLRKVGSSETFSQPPKNQKLTKELKSSLNERLSWFNGHDDTVVNFSEGLNSTKLSEKTLKKNQKTAVASTPNRIECPSFVIPATRQTRSRALGNQSTIQVPAPRSRLNRTKNDSSTCLAKPSSKTRLFSPNDSLQTVNGTPIRNPFSLVDPVKLLSPELRNLQSLMNSIENILSKSKAK